MKQKSKSVAISRASSKKSSGAETKNLPSIIGLLQSSWSMVTSRFGTLLGLTLLKGLVEISILVVAVMAGLFTGGTALVEAYNNGQSLISALTPELIRSLLGIGTVAFLAFLVESILTQVVLLRVLFNQDEGIMTALRRSVSSFWAILAVMVFIMVTSFGGMLLLLLPGVVFSVWFIFALYELVLYQTPVLLSLERSAETVRAHFWGILGRVVVFGILTSVVGAVFDEIAKSISPEFEVFVMIASLLYQALIGWMSVSYIGVLYRTVRVQTVALESVKTAALVAGAGWLLALVIGFSILRNLNGELLNPATFLSETGLFSQSMVEELLPGVDPQAPMGTIQAEPSQPEVQTF